MEGGAGGPLPPWTLDGPPSVPPSGPPTQNFWGWPCKYQIAATLYINKHNHPLYIKKHTLVKLYWANIIIILIYIIILYVIIFYHSHIVAMSKCPVSLMVGVFMLI